MLIVDSCTNHMQLHVPCFQIVGLLILNDSSVNVADKLATTNQDIVTIDGNVQWSQQ